jgi:predicted methyltransferase
VLGLIAVASCAKTRADRKPDPASDEHDSMHGHGNHPHEALNDPARVEWQKPGEVVAAMAIAEGMVVADVGAGTGYFEPYLSRAVGTRGKVLALDISPQLVSHMKRRFEDAGLGNVEARLVPPADPGLTARSVDRVLVVDTWHHMKERVAYARKLRQALTNAGRIVIVDYPTEAPRGPPPELRLKPDVVVKELEAAGFTARVVPESLPNQFIVVGELSAVLKR